MVIIFQQGPVYFSDPEKIDAFLGEGVLPPIIACMQSKYDSVIEASLHTIFQLAKNSTLVIT